MKHPSGKELKQSLEKKINDVKYKLNRILKTHNTQKIVEYIYSCFPILPLCDMIDIIKNILNEYRSKKIEKILQKLILCKKINESDGPDRYLIYLKISRIHYMNDFFHSYIDLSCLTKSSCCNGFCYNFYDHTGKHTIEHEDGSKEFVQDMHESYMKQIMARKHIRRRYNHLQKILKKRKTKRRGF